MNPTLTIASPSADRIPRRAFLHRLGVSAVLVGAASATTARPAAPLLPAAAPAAPGPAAAEMETAPDDPIYYADPGWSR